MAKTASPQQDPDRSTDQISSYELQRLQTIENNRKMLMSLSIPTIANEIMPIVVKKETVSLKPKPKPKPKPKLRVKRDSGYLTRATAKKKGIYLADTFRESTGVLTRSVRRKEEERAKARIAFDLDDEDESTKLKVPRYPRTNSFGHIKGIPVGTIFQTRMQCSAVGVHRPVVAGIYGTFSEGCYSICFSGGYPDDVDQGDYILFSGSGGRDLKGTKANPKNLRVAPQTFDQTWTGNNLMLKISADEKRPIRVVRGYKGKAPYAPEDGYRYDGLYQIQEYTRTKGKSGFLICQFKMVRLPGQPPLKY